MFLATIADYDGNTIESVKIDAQCFEDAEKRAEIYANNAGLDWDTLYVAK